MTLIDCHPRNPFRPPHWRWAQGRLLHEQRLRANRRRDDAWVLRARRFQVALARAGGDLDHPRLARLDPAVLGACRLHRGAPRPRWEAEARLVAGQDIGAIAARLGLPTEVLVAYEALFYAVGDRLEILDWVAAVVFGPRVYIGLAPDDLELIWKVFAYSGGPLILDAVIAATVGGPTALQGEAAAGGRSVLSDHVRLAIAVKTLPITPESAPLLIRLADRLRDLERADAAGSAGPAFAPIVLPARVIPTPTTLPDVAMSEADSSQAEVVRADEPGGGAEEVAHDPTLATAASTPIAAPGLAAMPDLRWTA